MYIGTFTHSYPELITETNASEPFRSLINPDDTCSFNPADMPAAIYAGLPVLFFVNVGGFFTNATYCIQQNIKNKTGHEYFSVKSNVFINNLLFCALAGVLWYSQFSA